MAPVQPLVKQLFIPLFIVFLIVNCFCLVFTSWLTEKKVDTMVVISANLLLFLIGVINGAMSLRAMKNPNPNVFVRSSMAGTFIKLLVMAAAVMIYSLTAGDKISVAAIIVSMGLYVIYSIIEVKASLKLNRKKDAGN